MEAGEKSLEKYFGLFKRIEKLKNIVDNFSKQNKDLQQQVIQLTEYLESQTDKQRILELEREVKNLKIENKLLKEKEKTIRTKIERLAVKLDQIQL
jgi:predicted  nucleic acid-binding Zn-ribbon protein